MMSGGAGASYGISFATTRSQQLAALIMIATLTRVRETSADSSELCVTKTVGAPGSCAA
jgi:hypothetical protein